MVLEVKYLVDNYIYELRKGNMINKCLLNKYDFKNKFGSYI